MKTLIIYRDYLLETLNTASKERSNKMNWVGPDHSKELEWVIFEREQMWKAVNNERTKLNKLPVALSEIKRVETTALGHVDYAKKFSLYCAELILDIPHKP